MPDPERQPYVHIFVHEDVLTDAVEVVNRLAEAGVLDEEDRRTLSDLVNPLPEVDVFGYLPNIRHSRLLPKRGAR